MTEYKVTRIYSERHIIYVQADSEEVALKKAKDQPITDWEDQMDERGLDNPEYEVEEDV